MTTSDAPDSLPGLSFDAAPSPSGVSATSRTTSPKKAAPKKAAPRKRAKAVMKDDTSMPETGSLARLPNRISPSRAKEFIQCPKLFFYKTVLGITTPNTVHTARGTLAHTAFELIFEHPRLERTSENAVAYVRPAWDAMVNPLKERALVEAGTPEDIIRTHTNAYRENIEPGSKSETTQLARAADYRALVAPGSSEEEDLLSSAEQMVSNWYFMENPEKFDPAGRETHLQATAMGVTLHGFIDRLDKVTLPDHSTRWYISDYKGLPLDTPLPTPTGRTTMERVAEGDEIFSASGAITRVIGKSKVKNLTCYQLTFDDNSTIVCDVEHRWQVNHTPSTNPTAPVHEPQTVVVDTKKLLKLWSAGHLISIPNAEPLDLPGDTPLVDPYALGRRVATHADPLHAPTTTLPFALAEFHLRTSTEYRLSLLQGFMSVGGSWELEAERAMFTTASAPLAEVVEDLVAGLGGTFTRTEGSVMQSVVFMLPQHCPFAPNSAHHLPVIKRSLERRLVNVVQVEGVPTQCIMVDAPDHLFLAGRQMVPTHNTGKVPSDRFLDDAFFAMKIYAVLLYETQNVVAHELRLIYVKEGNQKAIKTLKVDMMMINSTKAKMSAVWKQINAAAKTETWTPKPGPLCPWCHFQAVCPAFNPDMEGMLPEERRLRGEDVPDDAPSPLKPAQA